MKNLFAALAISSALTGCGQAQQDQAEQLAISTDQALRIYLSINIDTASVLAKADTDLELTAGETELLKSLLMAWAISHHSDYVAYGIPAGFEAALKWHAANTYGRSRASRMIWQTFLAEERATAWGSIVDAHMPQ